MLRIIPNSGNDLIAATYGQYFIVYKASTGQMLSATNFDSPATPNYKTICQHAISDGILIDRHDNSGNYGFRHFEKNPVGCHSSCNLCTGILDTECVGCTVGKKLQGNLCVSACTANFYLHSVGQSVDEYCAPCDSSCKTCSDNQSTNCLTCDQTSGTKFFNSGTCLANCP